MGLKKLLKTTLCPIIFLSCAPFEQAVATGLKASENFVFSGVTQLDGKWRDQEKSNVKDNEVDIRRARLAVSSDPQKKLSYRLQYDFAGSVNVVTDAFVSYKNNNNELRIGHFKPSFSLEKIISVANITFIDRSVITASTPARLMGFQGSKFGENWQAALGIFGEGFGSKNKSDESNYSISARATYAPINNCKALLHVGISSSYYDRNKDTKVLDANNVRANPIDEEYYIDFELAAKLNSVYFQGEYILNHVNYDNDAKGSGDSSTTGLKADYYGYYLQASWFLTGDEKEYRVRSGDFGAVKIKNSFGKNGLGAFELAARFSKLDRNDNYDGRNITLGKTYESTLALNWYPNENLRVMINYQKVAVDFISYERKYDIFGIRTQLSF